MAEIVFSQEKDSIRTLSNQEIKDGRCFNVEDQVRFLKAIEKSEAFDSVVAAKEEEAKDLAGIAIRMQHNLDLQNRLNDDFRKQIANQEELNVDCEKQKEIIIKTQKHDKLKKVIIGIIVGFIGGEVAAHTHF